MVTATSDVTVLVPLHRSAPFIGVVEANLSRLVPRCRVIISDATGDDDTLDRLSGRWAGHPCVELAGPRPLGAGWVDHYNDLLARCRTAWFMWLAHDDEIDETYVDRCLAAVRSTPGAIGAFGRIEPVDGTDPQSAPAPMCAPGVVPGGVDSALAAVADWDLGTAFRSVFTADVPPIAHTTDTDEWADLVWLFGRLLDGPMVHVTDVAYRKRYRPDSTHAGWRAELEGPLLAPFLAAEILRVVEPTRRRAVLSALGEWSAGHAHRTIERSRAEVRDQERRGDALQTALGHEHVAVERLRSEADGLRRSMDDLRRSSTWRVGSAIVGAVGLPGRLLRRFRRERRRP